MPNNIYILEYTRYASIRHNIYKHIHGTKPKHAKGQVTYNIKEFKYKLSQRGALDIR